MRILLAFVVLLGLSSISFADDQVDYLRDVKPILARHCYSCHAAKVQKAKLRLDTAALLHKGGRSGPAIAPGRADKSLLIEAVNGTEGVTQMPYKKPALARSEVRILTQWINHGAPAPAGEKAGDMDHWAFRTPIRPQLPVVSERAWPKNAIDQFILARLEKEHLQPSPEASRATLIRRLYLDLIGLPPGVQEVDTFCAASRPDAYELLVDRLLASPHYGERWGRHWLDLARYADTQGFTIDGPREIWKYRDWVIDMLNRDLPFNRFVIEQMAGDMLPGATVEQKIATGFHRNTLINEEGGIDLEQFRVEAVADRVNTTGTVFLGLTLGCARCHDHKYDPISQREYFQLFAFLNNQSEPTLSLATPDAVKKKEAISAQLAKLEEELDDKLRKYAQATPEAEKEKWQREITLILNLGYYQRTEGQKRTLAAFFGPKSPEFKGRFDRIAALKKEEPRFATTMVLAELPQARDTNLHVGGDFTRKGEKVIAAVPAVLHSLNGDKAKGISIAGAKRQADRLDMAYWLADKRNPLIGRVTMNRLWQHYFGKGLVETENDFGTQGTPPSHPELLDWLATEFMERGWSLKAMHRLIVTSAVYRQSSKLRPELTRLDPDNKLLGRQNRLRLDAEIVRDQALAASGLLNEKLGGPSVRPPQPKGVYQFTQVQRTWQTSTGPDRFRRGIYTYLQRSAPYPALTVFDAPDATSTCTRRIRSNTPLQALTLLNDEAYMELAQALAGRIQDATTSERGRLEHAFRICLVRPPRPEELARLERYLESETGEHAASAWTAVARVLLNLDEFITRE